MFVILLVICSYRKDCPLMKTFISAFLLLIHTGFLYSQSDRHTTFSFVFMTDIHVMPERNAEAGFAKAIDAVNLEKPDFVITGGDLVYDALGVSYARADSLFSIYTAEAGKLKMPVYNTIGNHEHFAVYRKSGADTLNPEAGTGMYEKRIGKTYQSFTHKGWKFFLLNSVRISENRRYSGFIDPEQAEWIRDELAQTDTAMPVIVVTHIPLRTVFAQVTDSARAPNGTMDVIANANQVLDLFKRHNLKLVLQGHMHYREEIFVNRVWFVTGGSVAAAWWQGPYMGIPEGYLVVEVEKGDIRWEYKPYGWTAVR